jgi:two-component system CheB/CheR fusion protein
MRLKVNPYIFCLCTVAIAFFIQHAINSFLVEDVYLFLIVAMFLSAWYGGFFPGLLATVLSIFLADYFFIEPKFLILQSQREILRVSLILLEGLLFSLLSESRKRGEMERDKAYRAEHKSRKMVERALRSREEFISVVSHELKSPITSQKGFLHIIKMQTQKTGQSEYEKYITKIEQQTNKLTTLINDFLDISKLQVGKLKMNFSKCDINQLLLEVVEEIRATGANHEIIIIGSISTPVLCDRLRISQVLTNLLTNAIKYSPNAKTVEIELVENKKHVKISVKDHGIGISQKDQKKLFSKYYRVEGSNENKFMGFGMGLYIVSEIIKLHHGNIILKSTKGKGSKFTFSLPAKKLLDLDLGEKIAANS